jgi:hypothetical protein
MWSAAVFDPAFPGLSAIARVSGPCLAVVGEHRQRVEAVGVLPCRGGPLLVELAQVRGKVCEVLPVAPGFVSAEKGAGGGRCRRCR